MKTGDKVYCKETYLTRDLNTRNITFLKDCWYEVIDSKVNTCSVYSITEKRPVLFKIKFYLEITEKLFHYMPEFKKYFITEKEVRKQKLEKICSSQID